VATTSNFLKLTLGCHLLTFWKVKSQWPWTCGVLSVIWKGTYMYKFFFSPHRDLTSQKKMGEHLQMKTRSHYMKKRRDRRKIKIRVGEQQNSHPREEKKTHLRTPHLEVKTAISWKEGLWICSSTVHPIWKKN